MKLFASKRGDVTEIVMEPPIILALVFGVIFLILMGFVAKISVSMEYEKTFLAIYGGTMIEALYPASSIAVFDSNIDTLGLTFNFSDGRVEVYDQLEYETPPREERAYYIFTGDKTVKFKEGIVAPTFSKKDKKKKVEKKVELRFVKQGNEILVGNVDEIKPNFNKLSCPTFETKGNIAEKLLFLGVIEGRALLEETKSKEEVRKASAAVIVYRNVLYEKDTIIAYISSKQTRLRENRKLACLILNQLTDDEDLNMVMQISDVAIIPTDEFSILNYGDLAVLLEFRTKADINKELASIKRLFENGITEYQK